MPQPSTALGSFLHFCGLAMLTFPDLLNDKARGLRPALTLFPFWRETLVESGMLPSDIFRLHTGLSNLVDGLDDALIGEAMSDYNRFFISADAPVPMWESLWLSSEKILFTEETEQVRALFHRFNMPLVRFRYEAEDHLGYELAFAGALFDKVYAPGTLQADVHETSAALHDFLQDHLLRWGPEALEAAETHAHSPLWKALFQTLHAVLRQLEQEL